MMFCPFIKDECNPECLFNNNCYDEGDSENCSMMDAIRNIQSDGFTERSPRQYMDSIESDLAAIKSNTGSDQTDSYTINSTLDDIKDLLEEIKNKM